jgi:hypothetical protein
VERLGNLNQIPELLATRSAASALMKFLNAFRFPLDVTEPEWLAATKIVGNAAAADLSWMDREDQQLLRSLCTDFIRNGFTKYWPGGFIAETKLKDSLLPFVNWLETQPDRQVLYFAWDLLAATWRGAEHADYHPVLWMKRSGRLKGEISFSNLEVAVALAEEGSAMYWWPDERWRVMHWSRDTQPYLDLMNHSSYLVRGAAAGCLGQMFRGCTENACAEGAPSAEHILEFIKQQEQTNAGVAGPFLMGAQWANGWSYAADFDYRSWFLDVLRASAREQEMPHEQTLEFYAHEFFSGDADAIEEFLRMGRKHLAVMTATERPENIYELLPLLQKMAASDDPQIARAIKTYLADGRPHAGSQFVDD